MMTELETMQRAKSYIDKLANGMDPLTDEMIKDDSVINNVRISRCLFYVSGVLQQVIDNGGEIGRKRKSEPRQPFSITDEQKARIIISETPIGIMEFSKSVKAVLPENMRTLAVTKITDWLVENEYLREEIVQDKTRRVATPKGEHEGILTVDAVSRDGIPYKKNIYTAEAQRFIIANLELISEGIIEL